MTEHTFASDRAAGYHAVAPAYSITAVRASTHEHARLDVTQGAETPAAEVVRMGRPYGVDSDRRRQELLRLLAGGSTFKTACRDSRLSPDALVTLLDEDDFWTVAKALREGRAAMAAVTLADVEAEAA